MIYDIVPRKNTKHAILTFQIKNFSQIWHQGEVLLAFNPSDHGLRKLHSKIPNLDPIFGRFVHLSMANNIHNLGFFEFPRKNRFTIFSGQKEQNMSFFVKRLPSVLCTPPLQFSCRRPCRKAISRVWGIMSAYTIYNLGKITRVPWRCGTP
jgi:hypothetical protein